MAIQGESQESVLYCILINLVQDVLEPFFVCYPTGCIFLLQTYSLSFITSRAEKTPVA